MHPCKLQQNSPLVLPLPGTEQCQGLVLAAGGQTRSRQSGWRQPVWHQKRLAAPRMSNDTADFSPMQQTVANLDHSKLI